MVKRQIEEIRETVRQMSHKSRIAWKSNTYNHVTMLEQRARRLENVGMIDEADKAYRKAQRTYGIYKEVIEAIE